MHQNVVTPNLFIIGAAKAGTNTIHHVLSGSSDVFFSDPREPNYFAAKYNDDSSWYFDLFRPGADFKWRGEKTVAYSRFGYAEETADRIFRVSPDAHIIYCLRQPHERVVSHWRMIRRNRSGVPDFSDLFNHSELWRALVLRCRYMDIARPFIERFGSRRVKLCLLDDLETDRSQFFEDLCSFLGVSSADLRFPSQPALNSSDRSKVLVNKPIISDEMYSRISKSVSDDVEELFKYLGRDKAIWNF